MNEHNKQDVNPVQENSNDGVNTRGPEDAPESLKKKLLEAGQARMAKEQQEREQAVKHPEQI